MVGFNTFVLEESAALEPHCAEWLRCSLTAAQSLLAIVSQLLEYTKFEHAQRHGGVAVPLADGPLRVRDVLDEPLLGALCDAEAPPLPPRVVCVLAAPPAVCSKWRAKAAACVPPVAFLDLPVSPGRLLARLRDAADAAAAAADEPGAQHGSESQMLPRCAPPPPCALRVLVADDSAMNAWVAVAVLRGCGVAEPRIVGDGLQAVAACCEESFDAIFMDSQMPMMSGLDAVRAIRALEAEAGAARRRAFIVALTASDGENWIPATSCDANL